MKQRQSKSVFELFPFLHKKNIFRNRTGFSNIHTVQFIWSFCLNEGDRKPVEINEHTIQLQVVYHTKIKMNYWQFI